MPKRSSSGFTLVELLVVISIIAILSAIGLVSYNGIRNNALKAKRLSDLNAIKKAYEANYDPTLRGGQGGYKGITDSNFASGQTPKRDDGSSYIVTGPEGSGASGGNFAACINTLDGSACTSSSQTNCSCVKSDQGVPFTSPTGGSNPSCDPFGVLTQRLVGYWKFDEPSWNGNCSTQTVTDSIGSNSLKYCRFNATGNPVSGGAGTVSSGTDKFNNAFSLTNNTDALTLQSPTGLNPGTASMTWSGWFKTGSANGATIYRKSGSSNTGGVNITINGTGAIRCEVNNSPQISVSSLASTYADGAWHFFACVLDRTSQKLLMYADGNVPITTDASAINSTNLNQGTPIIGAAGSASYNPGPPASGYIRFNGSIDDFRIYSRALNNTEIASLRNSGNGCVQ